MKVLLAVDGSKHSESAVETLKNFKFSDGDQIKIITVIDMAVPPTLDFYGGYLPNTIEIERNARENAEKIVEATTQKIKNYFSGADVFVASEVLSGSPESRIVETAEKFQADLIVVGSHGYKRWERILLGSVSNSVVHHAPCSVLVVRSPK